MIWIVSRSSMSSSFLECCINNVDLSTCQEQGKYKIVPRNSLFGSYIKIESILLKSYLIEKKYKEAKVVADNAIQIHINDVDEDLINWIIKEGDTLIRIRHIDNPILWLQRETYKAEYDKEYFINRLVDNISADDNLPDYINNIPYLDTRDYLTPYGSNNPMSTTTHKLKTLAPEISLELHNDNLAFYMKQNMKNLTNLDLLNDILVGFFTRQI